MTKKALVFALCALLSLFFNEAAGREWSDTTGDSEEEQAEEGATVFEDDFEEGETSGWSSTPEESAEDQDEEGGE